MKRQLVKKQSPQAEKLNIETLWRDCIENLYQLKLSEEIVINPVTEIHNVGEGWGKLQNNIIEAARESLDTCMIKKLHKPNKI